MRFTDHERDARRRYFTPPPRLTVSAWADRYRKLPRTGKWQTDHTPYLRGIMDAIGDEDVERIAFMKPTQVGGTEVLLNALGYYMAEDPCPILVIQPTEGLAKSFSRERIDTLLAGTPRLRGLVRQSGRRSSDNALQYKAFPNGFCAIVGSNAPAGLRSRAIRVGLFDELSAWPDSAGDEGDPLKLAERRMATFWNRKMVATSTPTLEGFCAITRLWQESDQRRYLVACPHCGTRQPLRWRNGDDTVLHGDEVEDPAQYRLIFERDEAGEVIADSVTYTCDHGCVIEERHKGAMLAGGEWSARRPGRKVAGFHLNALYSPWVRWAEVCDEFLKARHSAELLKTFQNTFCGLPWQDAGERIEPHALMARAEALAEAPDGVAGLCVSADVQADRIEGLCVAFADREESYVLEWAQFPGDPQALATWEAFGAWRAALAAKYGAPLLATAVDTGYQTESVWKWIDRQPLHARVFGVKGQPGRGRPVMTPPGAATKKRQRRPWLVGVDTAKDLLAQRLRAPVPGPGGMHFADTLDPTFFEQLTAEQLVTVYRGGRPVREWKLIPGRRNEALDLTVYAIAALYGLGPRVVGQLGALAARRTAAQQQPAAPTPQPPAPGVQAPTRPAGPRRSFAQRWR
jgi:terminase, large subunit